MDSRGIIAWIVLGLIAGGIARLLVPGKDPMGCLGTLLLGVVGSFVGGFIANLLFGGGNEFRPASLIGSVLGAILVLLLLRAVGRRRRI